MPDPSSSGLSELTEICVGSKPIIALPALGIPELGDDLCASKDGETVAWEDPILIHTSFPLSAQELHSL